MAVAECVDVFVYAEELLTLPELVRGFLGLQSHRAPEITTIPAEAYKFAAREVAYVHWPIVAHAMLRQAVPVTWAGTLVTGIRKPCKPLNVVAGLRSIALYEAPPKELLRLSISHVAGFWMHWQEHALWCAAMKHVCASSAPCCSLF